MLYYYCTRTTRDELFSYDRINRIEELIANELQKKNTNTSV